MRTSKHILKYSNTNKLDLLEQLFKDYEESLKYCVELIVIGQLPLKTLLSSSKIPKLINIEHSWWKQVIYKNASEIVRSTIEKNNQLRYKRYKKVYAYFKKHNRQVNFLRKKFKELNIKFKYIIKPKVKNISITLDNRFTNMRRSNYFNEFIRLTLPYFKEGKRRALTINLPIKYHKQSLKYNEDNNWNKRESIQLQRINNNFYLNFFYDKEEVELKETGISIGLDVGYKKLITTSREEYLGGELLPLYNKITKAVRGSKNYIKLLKQRDNLLKQTINKLNLEEVRTIFVEDLKGLKADTFLKENKKTNRGFRNKSQYALYTKVHNILKLKCEEQGITIVKVSPSYTSQTCSRCKIIDKESRKGERFICNSCGLEIDADYNAAINILNRGVYSPSNTGNLIKEDICL